MMCKFISLLLLLVLEFCCCSFVLFLRQSLISKPGLSQACYVIEARHKSLILFLIIIIRVYGGGGGGFLERVTFCLSGIYRMGTCRKRRPPRWQLHEKLVEGSFLNLVS